MGKDVSVLVIDVNEELKKKSSNEINDYFEELQINIASWTQYIIPAKVTNSDKNELIVVSSGYASTYILAFYLSLIWKYKNYLPYFGMSFGTIEEDLSTIKLENGGHPLIKEARQVNKFLKNQQMNNQFRFTLPSSSNEQGFSIYRNEFETLLNMSLGLLEEQFIEQTEIQALVGSLYFILGQQTKVSEYLDRTKSTISSHMKNGKVKVIFEAFQSIVHVLNSLQTEESPSKTNELQANIKRNLTQHLQIHFPMERE